MRPASFPGVNSECHVVRREDALCGSIREPAGRSVARANRPLAEAHSRATFPTVYFSKISPFADSTSASLATRVVAVIQRGGKHTKRSRPRQAASLNSFCSISRKSLLHARLRSKNVLAVCQGFASFTPSAPLVPFLSTPAAHPFGKNSQLFSLRPIIPPRSAALQPSRASHQARPPIWPAAPCPSNSPAGPAPPPASLRRSS